MSSIKKIPSIKSINISIVPVWYSVNSIVQNYSFYVNKAKSNFFGLSHKDPMSCWHEGVLGNGLKWWRSDCLYIIYMFEMLLHASFYPCRSHFVISVTSYGVAFCSTPCKLDYLITSHLVLKPEKKLNWVSRFEALKITSSITIQS